MDTYTTPSRGLSKAAIAIIGMVLLAGVLIVALVRDRIVNQPWREISITGTGKVAYTPDEALITLGVHIDNAPTAQDALSRLGKITNEVVPALAELGIPAENITTQSYNVFPQYYYPEGGPSRISGYSADQQIVVKASLASAADKNDFVSTIIETASAKGANQVMGVSFSVSNVDDLRQQALLLAIEDAKGRAQETALAAGVELKKVVSWWENPISIPGQPIPYYGGYGGGEMGMGGGNAGAIPSGSQEVVMQVNLNYSTK